MNYYGDSMTTITCPLCNSFNAKCNTSMLLTSEPPQYGFSCPDCNNHGYIYTHELHKYTPSVTLATTETTTALHDKVKSLEERIQSLEKLVVKLQTEVDVARFF